MPPGRETRRLHPRRGRIRSLSPLRLRGNPAPPRILRALPGLPESPPAALCIATEALIPEPGRIGPSSRPCRPGLAAAGIHLRSGRRGRIIAIDLQHVRTGFSGETRRWPRRTPAPRGGPWFWSPQVKRLTAVTALGAFLFVMLLAVWPVLHEAFHGHEASSNSHHCLVTVLAKGQVLVADLAVLAPVPLEVSILGPLALASVHSPVDVQQPSARAPPSLPA